MIPILFLIGLGAFVLVSRGSPRERSYQPAPYMIAGGDPVHGMPPAPPSPMAVLGEYARTGAIPPPRVLICAIAEAQTLGRADVATDLVRMYGTPSPMAVLTDYVRSNAMPPPQVVICAIAEAQVQGRDDVAHQIAQMFGMQAPDAVAQARDANVPPAAQKPSMQYVDLSQDGAPVAMQPTPPPNMRGAQQSAPPVGPRMGATAPPAQAPAATGPHPFLANDDQIQAMLNSNPQAFMAMAAQGVPQAAAVDLDVEAAPGHAGDYNSGHAEAAPSPIGDHDASVPVDGIPGELWEGFCNRIEREPAEYESSRHVGRYRQRRERLIEIGIDPDAIVGSAAAQRAALNADMADAYKHVEQGKLDRHVGRNIRLPDGARATVTLSGILGVVQAAGLDHATDWLESQLDRKRYRHTTEAFVNTNGIF